MADSQSAPELKFPDWVPEQLRTEENKTLTRYHGKPIDDLIKSEVGLEKKLGNAIFKPGENATPEEIASYRKKMEVPEKPEDYLKALQLPKGSELIFEQETLTAIADFSHKAGLPLPGLKAVVESVASNRVQALTALTQQIDKQDAEWQAKNKQAFASDYEKVLERRDQILAKKGDADLDVFKKAVETFGIKNNPYVVKALDSLAQRDKGASFSGSGTGGGRTKADIDREIGELSKDQAYWNQSHRDHQAKVDRMVRLRQEAREATA